MLDKIKKTFANEGQFKTEMDALVAKLEASEQSVLSLTSELEKVVSEKSELAAAIDSMKAELEALAEVKASLEKQAQETRLAARKEKLAAVIGTSKLDATFEATKNLEDSAFEAVCNAFAASLEAEEKTNPLFNESGVDAVADVGAATETYEMRELQKMFAKKN